MSDYEPPLAPEPQAEQTRRKRAPLWLWLIIALGVILVAALTFATTKFLSPGAPSTDPPPTDTQESTATPPTTEPTGASVVAPIVLPSCEALLPEHYAVAAALAASLGPEPDLHWDNVGSYKFSMQFGPAAQTAFGLATQSQGCSYPSNLETGVSLYTMELPSVEKEAFIAALRSDDDFTETNDGGIHVFSWEDSEEFGHWFSKFTTHAFIGDVWLASFSPYPPEEHIPTATAAILAANPEIG